MQTSLSLLPPLSHALSTELCTSEPNTRGGDARTREETEQAVRSAGLKKSHIHKSPMKRNTVRRCPDENGRHLHTARTHVDPIPFYTSRYSHRSTTPHPPLHRPTCPRATAAHMPHRRHIGPPLRRPVSGVPMRAGPGPGLVPCRSQTLSSDLDTGVASHRAPCTCRTCPRSCLLNAFCGLTLSIRRRQPSFLAAPLQHTHVHVARDGA